MYDTSVGGILKRVFSELRQICYPASFRIFGGDFVPEPAHAPSRRTSQIASAATALWRLRKKLQEAENAVLPKELRHLPRHVMAAWDAMESCDIRVQDHTNQGYDPGMAVSVLTFQPEKGAFKPRILETLRPTVFFENTIIQRADVIVAVPERESSSGQSVLPEE